MPRSGESSPESAGPEPPYWVEPDEAQTAQMRPPYGVPPGDARTVIGWAADRDPPGATRTAQPQVPYRHPGGAAGAVPVRPPYRGQAGERGAWPAYRSAVPLPSKVPPATPSFWLTKVLTTAMGEATSDFLVHAINPYLAVFLGAVLFAAAFILQMSVRRYIIWVYWLAVVGVGVFGTMVADVLHVALGIPYAVCTPFFALALGVVLVTWYGCERTLSIHTIYTRRREMFYWATVVVTFALGTAAGDMMAATVGLGYLPSAFMFVAIILIPAIGYWRFGMNPVLAFWFAYIVTRPVGASFADWVGFPPSAGGVGFGHGPVAAVLTIMIAACVAYMTLRAGRDGRPVPGRAGAGPLPGGGGSRPWPDGAGGPRRPDRPGGPAMRQPSYPRDFR